MKFSQTALAALLLTFAGASFAQATASKDVNVTVSLTSQCRVATASAGAVTLAFGTYVAFRPTDLTATQTSVAFECTRGLASPTYSWDGTTAFGVVAGLNYELAATAGTFAAGTAATAVSGGIGSPDTWPVLIDGTMPLGQAGTDTSGVATALRTLTITF